MDKLTFISLIEYAWPIKKVPDNQTNILPIFTKYSKCPTLSAGHLLLLHRSLLYSTDNTSEHALNSSLTFFDQ